MLSNKVVSHSQLVSAQGPSGHSGMRTSVSQTVPGTLASTKLQIQPQRIQIVGNNRTQTEALTDVIPSSVQNIVSLYHNFDASSNIS